jgi:hypothetical protein
LIYFATNSRWYIEIDALYSRATITADGSSLAASETTILAEATPPVNYLNVDGQSLVFEAWGEFAANANNKQVRAKYGTTTLFDTGALAFNGTDWHVRGVITRTAASAQKCVVVWNSSDGLLLSSVNYTLGALNNGAANAVTITAVAPTADGDVLGRELLVDFRNR